MTQAMARAIQEFTWGIIKDFSLLPNDLPPIRAGSSLREELGIAPEIPLILTSGVLDTNKNIGILLEALSKLSIPCALVVVGDGPGRADLEKVKSELGLANVHFTGWVKELSTKLNGISLTVHPSRSEGVSNSVLESLAANIPVLASDTPEMREVMSADELLFNPNSPDELANKIRAALQDATKVRELCYQISLTYRFDWESRIVQIIID